ncbi:pseudouridine synthase [Rhodoferax koreense]|uniref:pseudouridine synthase n=1 Tax=Rhodoferax koreensis TaxID=1842727 RepID=UPI0012FF9AF5|nr:pseudouridine synthase [Rhodoferax koreense]
MSEANQRLPTRNGVGPSCVGLPAGPWATVLDFFADRFPDVSRATWLQRMAEGLLIDEAGAPVHSHAAYRPHTRLYYYREVPSEAPIPFEAEILFQDDHLLAVDKPHFLPMVPGGRYLQHTLLVRLKQQLGIDTLVPLHRIDRETAGMALFGIRPEERDAYHALFRERAVHKHYEAIAAWREGLELPLVRRSRMVEGTPFFRLQEVEGTPNSQTLVELVEQRGDWARYRLSPLTGRRHQLRVHMAGLGLPIRYDRFYPELDNSPEDHARPLQLLARAIGFTDPVTGQARHFESRRRLALP